jgi:hypothetical protein
MDNNSKYVRNLEEMVRNFLKPIKNITFNVVIRALTNCEILCFDKHKDADMLELLKNSAKEAGYKAAEMGIEADRPNEAGNRIEPFVVDALRRSGFNADIPVTKKGKRKSSGYPDIEIYHGKGWHAYIDCKTYAQKSKKSSFRAFYFSPSDEPKITRDSVHLVLSYRLEKRDNKYYPVHWHLCDLSELTGQIKHEFNASNEVLYSDKLVIDEGII